MSTHKENLSEVSLAQLETLTGAAYKTVKKRLGGLQPVRTDGKTLYFDPVVALRLIYEVGADAEKGVDTLDTERARLAKHQADRAELDVQERRRDLVPAAEVEVGWNDLVTAFRAKILSLPAKVAPMLPGIESVAQIQGVLRDALEDALTELAGYEPKQRDGTAPAEGGDQSGTAAAANRQSMGGQGASPQQ